MITKWDMAKKDFYYYESLSHSHALNLFLGQTAFVIGIVVAEYQKNMFGKYFFWGLLILSLIGGFLYNRRLKKYFGIK